jgi:hypothetical protein
VKRADGRHAVTHRDARGSESRVMSISSSGEDSRAEDGEQALPAREQLRVLAVRLQQVETSARLCART